MVIWLIWFNYANSWISILSFSWRCTPVILLLYMYVHTIYKVFEQFLLLLSNHYWLFQYISILLLNLTLPVTFPFFLSLFFSSYPFWIPSLPTTSLPRLPLSLPFSSLPFPSLLSFPSHPSTAYYYSLLTFFFSLPFPSHAIPFHHPFTSL